MSSFAESCGLPKKNKKEWAILWFGLQVNERGSDIFIELVEWIWKQGRSKFELTKYKDKRREYESLIKWEKEEYENKKKLDIGDDFREIFF